MALYNESKSYFLKYPLVERPLPGKYTGSYTVSLRELSDKERCKLVNPEEIPAVLLSKDKKLLNPLFRYDRNSIKIGEGLYDKYVNANGLKLLYDVRFGYDGYAFEIIYQNPRELQLLVDEGDGWKIVFDCLQVGHNENKTVALRVAFEDADGQSSAGNYKMRRFCLRGTGWFGGIIREKACSVVRSILPDRPLAVFEGTSITECCNGVCGFNAFSYARRLSDIFGFDYLCLAQGGTGMNRPTSARPRMLDRIDCVIDSEPDIIFAEVGINDVAGDPFRAATDEYLNKLREKLPATFVVMIGSYSPKYDIQNPPSSEKDEILREVCRKYAVPFIDISSGKVYGTDGEMAADMGAPLITGTGTVFEPNGTGTADRYTGLPTVRDSCHCNAAAYRMMAEYIRSALYAIANNLN